jgi:hypothetical protein
MFPTPRLEPSTFRTADHRLNHCATRGAGKIRSETATEDFFFEVYILQSSIYTDLLFIMEYTGRPENSSDCWSLGASAGVLSIIKIARRLGKHVDHALNGFWTNRTSD